MLNAEKKKRVDEVRQLYINLKSYNVVQIPDCEWWSINMAHASLKQHLRDSFTFKRPLREEQLRETVESSSMFDYVQCSFHVPEHLRGQFANFLSIFKNTNACRQDIARLMQEYAAKDNSLTSPSKF